MAIRPDKVKEHRERQGLSQSELARRLGIKPQSIQQLESGAIRSPRYLHKLAEILRVDWRELVDEADREAAEPSQVAPESVTPLPGFATMSRDLPVMGTAAGGNNGDFSQNGTIADYVRRPAVLDGVKNAFAIYLVGDSMSPRFEHGDLIIVHPGRPIVSGCDVLIELHAVDGEVGHCMVKTYLRKANGSYILRQYNPPRDDIAVPIKRVKYIYRILRTAEIIGI